MAVLPRSRHRNSRWASEEAGSIRALARSRSKRRSSKALQPVASTRVLAVVEVEEGLVRLSTPLQSRRPPRHRLKRAASVEAVAALVELEVVVTEAGVQVA